MSLIIKGKDIPKSCYDCDLYSGEGFLCPLVIETTNDWTLEAMYKRVDECPLVEIPTQHGRLIDADQLQAAIHGCLCETCQTFPCEKGIGCLIEDVFNLIDQAPTIIEAEVSE
jgi:hypothetical protein